MCIVLLVMVKLYVGVVIVFVNKVWLIMMEGVVLVSSTFFVVDVFANVLRNDEWFCWYVLMVC